MKPIVATCSLCFLLGAVPASGADCENWNTLLFFMTATPKVVTDCLQAGADPNARDQHDFTPLHMAAVNANPAVITALVEAGADPKPAFRGDLSPLHLAAVVNRHPAVITALVEAGVDPNARDENGVLSRMILEQLQGRLIVEAL